MKTFLSFFICALIALTAFAQKADIVVERKSTAPDTIVMPTDTASPRMVIDPGALVFQMRADSINQLTEARIRDLITKLERKFENPQVEEEVGRLIGEAVMQQQMALLDLQMERAISLRDTLLMMGLQLALEELLVNSDMIRNEIMKQLRSLEMQTTPR